MQIIETNALTDAQKNDVTALQTRCRETDGLRCEVFLSGELNFDPDLPCFYLGYEAGNLSAFLTVFLPSGREGEVLGFTAPERRREGRFRALLRAAAERVAAAGVPRLLLRVESASESGKGVLTRYAPTVFDHAENRLVCRASDAVEAPDDMSGYALHKAEEKDGEAYAALMRVSFGDGPADADRYFRHILEAPDREALMLLEREEPIGVCSIHYEAEDTFLYGLGVRPDRRGRGCGHVLLGLVLARCFQRCETVFLDVDTDNPSALGLYFSCGFLPVFREDYHALPLTPERIAAL